MCAFELKENPLNFTEGTVSWVIDCKRKKGGDTSKPLKETVEMLLNI